LTPQDTDNRAGGHNTRSKDNRKTLSTFDGPRLVIDPDPYLNNPQPKSFGPWPGAPDRPTTTSDNSSWKAVRDERLSPPEDFFCPHCKTLILSAKSGRFICQFCGESAHPPTFHGYSKLAEEHAKEKRHEIEMSKHIRKIKYAVGSGISKDKKSILKEEDSIYLKVSKDLEKVSPEKSSFYLKLHNMKNKMKA
jgi:uncharacterized Zn finger protein (UPF0148 family)